MKTWFTTPPTSYLSRHDLHLLEDIDNYRKKDDTISPLKKFLSHLWYMSNELVAFTFFDDKMIVEIQQKMVKALETLRDEYCSKISTNC